MKKLGKSYETHIFEGAGHGFLGNQAGRRGEPESGATGVAVTVAFFRKHLGRLRQRRGAENENSEVRREELGSIGAKNPDVRCQEP